MTEYGRGKLAAQQQMLGRGHAAARLGLVIGPGGLYRRMVETLTRHRVAPLVDGGRDPVPIIAIADLAQAVALIVERRLPGLFNLFNPDLVPLRDVLREIRAGAARRTLLVPVPSRLLLLPVWLAAKAGIRLPIDADNLRALRANAGLRDHSDLPAFVPQPLTLAEMVRAAAGARHPAEGGRPPG